LRPHVIGDFFLSITKKSKRDRFISDIFHSLVSSVVSLCLH
jgi:hypothetical protein